MFPPGETRVGKLTLRHQRFDDARWHGTIAIPAVVFCGDRGQPRSPSWLYSIHTWARASVYLGEIRGYDLRHRYATIQLYAHHALV